MTPSNDMIALLDSTKEYLSKTANPSFSPAFWCRNAGLDPELWDRSIAEKGQRFEEWFIRSLGLGALERAGLDRMFWAAISRALSEDSPKAAQLSIWADIQGYKKERPERATIPVLSTGEALEALVELGPDVLEMALALAKESASQPTEER